MISRGSYFASEFASVKINHSYHEKATLDSFVTQNTIPTASSAHDAWTQWFTPVPEIGLFRPIRSFTKDMIRVNRKKYSERQTLGTAFQKYNSFDSFQESYNGHTSTYSEILKEVRKRKREDRL